MEEVEDDEDSDQVDNVMDHLQTSTREAPGQQLHIGSLTAVDVASIFQ